MTRKVMQQALEAISEDSCGGQDRIELMTKLAAAIAQPVQPAIRMPKMPVHPEPHTYTWTALEMKAIHEYGKACFDAGGSQPVQPALSDIEQYRLQMAGISTAALGYWKKGDPIHPDYLTVALDDVAELYQKYDALFQKYVAQPIQPDLQAAAQAVLDRWNCPKWDWSEQGHTADFMHALQRAVDAQPAHDALRERLAQSEPLEYWNAVEGWVKIDEVREHFDSVGCGTIYKTAGEGREPLYTTPQPAQRTWVSLTDAEKQLAYYKVDSWRECIEFIETKLKEKNT